MRRKRYWIGQNEKKEERETAEREKVILKKEWERKELKENDAKLKGTVVILGTETTLKTAMKIFKARKGIEVIPAVHGDVKKGGVISADFYTVSRGERLYEEIKRKVGKGKLLGVIDITALDKEYEESLEIEKGKIKFLQEIIEKDREEGYKLLQVTYRLNNFQINTTTMQGARTAGLYRMLGAEYRQIESSVMDSDAGLEKEDEMIRQVEKEFENAGRENLTESCYRKGERYEPRMTMEKAEEWMPVPQMEEKYESNEAVVITGGTRGIGAEIAGRLVGRGIKNVVLMGREELPGEEEWKKILESGERPEIREKIKRLRGYRDKGVNVLYYHTDLTDEEGLKKMAEEIRLKAWKIKGVYHCAGLVSKDPAFIKKEMKDIEEVCEPKIKGTVLLHKALEKEPLSFYLLFSSISSVVPVLSVGQSDYAMANSYMDYYAEKEAGEGKSYMKSVQWPSWGESGMAAGAGGKQSPAYNNTGIEVLTTKEGLDYIDVIRRIPDTVMMACIVMPEEFETEGLLKREIQRLNKRGTERAKTVVKKAAVKTANLPGSIREWLKGIIKRELKLTQEQVDEDKPFDEYGVDSIVIAQLAQTLQKEIKTEVSPSIFIENRTINDLTKYFIANHEKEIEEILGMGQGQVTEEYPDEKESESKEEENEGVKTIEGEEIAVVGISCRLPGSPDKEGYWKLLIEGKKAIRPVPESRWQRRENRADYGGWIEDIEMFDPEIFELKDNDAAIMDPQARIILEEGLKAAYDAGYEKRDLSGKKVGVYIGGRLQYGGNVKEALQSSNPILGFGQNYLASNLSRIFNLTGPSMVVDTACSSGLAAMSMASDLLKSGRIEMAMVGSVSLIMNPLAHEMFEARNILSKNGEFHIFDRRSVGEVLGEGAGMVVLKRLKEAVRDGNKIYGVIKAIAVNNDGRTLGPGSPNLSAQKQVIGEALERSGKRIEDIGYIEVNGGGSPLIDSVEIKALSEVYQLSGKGIGRCSIGSIKPNIGHVLLTSGLAGFIRCALSLYHKQIPPFLSAEETPLYYDFKGSRIEFNREAAEWKVESGKKRATAQNSFPDGGTNCHVVMEEFTAGDDYVQRYFSLPVPVMNKKRFELTQKTLPEKSKTPFNNKEVDMSDFINKFRKKQNKESTRSFTSTYQNIWGITR